MRASGPSPRSRESGKLWSNCHNPKKVGRERIARRSFVARSLAPNQRNRATLPRSIPTFPFRDRPISDARRSYPSPQETARQNASRRDCNRRYSPPLVPTAAAESRYRQSRRHRLWDGSRAVPRCRSDPCAGSGCWTRHARRHTGYSAFRCSDQTAGRDRHG